MNIWYFVCFNSEYWYCSTLLVKSLDGWQLVHLGRKKDMIYICTQNYFKQVLMFFYHHDKSLVKCQLLTGNAYFLLYTHTHTISLSLSHTHTHTLSLSLSHTHTHTLSLSHTHTHSLSHSLTHTLSLSHTHLWRIADASVQDTSEVYMGFCHYKILVHKHNRQNSIKLKFTQLYRSYLYKKTWLKWTVYISC